MKKLNQKQNQKSGLLNRPEQSSTENRPQINFKRRYANRILATENLLDLLKRETPLFFQLAEVVGKWVWIQFAEKQPAEITRLLSEFGFHWNATRQAWQHPCGFYRNESADYDPRKRYGSYFPSKAKNR